ncbi:MAG: hypothetical protein HC817_00945 [Saprospiraceae bacterium]|nr:hypothetical protein [Saprospiraceae bacterium]
MHINDFFDLPWLQAVYWTLAIDWQFFIFVGLSFFWFNRSEWWARYPLYAALVGSRWWFEVSEREWLFYHVLLFVPGVVLFHFQKNILQDGNVTAFCWLFFMAFRSKWVGRI